MFQHPRIAGLQGWHWEVAVTYCDLLADICLHGATSKIRKLALLGNNKDASEAHRKRKSQPGAPMDSAGLLDLLYFKTSAEIKDKGELLAPRKIKKAAINVRSVRVCPHRL